MAALVKESKARARAAATREGADREVARASMARERAVERAAAAAAAAVVRAVPQAVAVAAAAAGSEAVVGLVAARSSQYSYNRLRRGPGTSGYRRRSCSSASDT